MTWFIVIVVISIQRFLNKLSEPIRVDWAGRYQRCCLDKVLRLAKGQGVWAVLLFVAPALLIMAFLDALIFHFFGRTGYALFGGLLLWYTIDARDLKKQPEFRLDPFNTLTLVYRTLFAPLFWFIIFGPLCLVLYYLVSYFDRHFQLSPSSETEVLALSTQRVLAILDWMPVRLFTFSFALVGQFTAVFKIWIKQVMTGPDVQLSLIFDCAQPIIHVIDDAIDLLNRVLVVWLAALTLVTIGFILG